MPSDGKPQLLISQPAPVHPCVTLLSIVPSLLFFIGCVLFYPNPSCSICDGLGAGAFTCGSALLTYGSCLAWEKPCLRPAFRILFNTSFLVGSVAFFPVFDASDFGCWMFIAVSCGFLCCEVFVCQLDYFLGAAGYALFAVGSVCLIFTLVDYTDCIHMYVAGSASFVLGSLVDIRRRAKVNVAPKDEEG